MRPRILLDIDGILTDFHAAVVRVAVEAGFQVSVDDLWVWNMKSALQGAGVPYNVVRLCTDAMAAEGFNDTLEPSPEALARLPELREAADVVFVTSPNPGCHTWIGERIAWMDRHFDVEASSILFTCSKSEVPGDVFIDDCWANVRDWEMCHPDKVAALWDAPYNRRALATCRIKSWDALIRLAQLLHRPTILP